MTDHVLQTRFLHVAVLAGRVPRWLVGALLETRTAAKVAEGRCGMLVVPSAGRPANDALVVLRYGDFVALHSSTLDRPAREQLQLLLGGSR